MNKGWKNGSRTNGLNEVGREMDGSSDSIFTALESITVKYMYSIRTRMDLGMDGNSTPSNLESNSHDVPLPSAVCWRFN